MLIIGCDYHPAFQQIAFVDTETASCKSGDWSTLRQRRSSTVIWRPREAECAWRWKPVDMRWFERLLAELTSSCGSGTPPRSPGSASKPKTDRQDAQDILRLLLKDDFPQIWVPSWENRDLRQLLWHRHRMVQARTRIMNQLQAVAINEGLRSKKRLWRDAGREQLESFRLAPWASRRRRDLLELLDRLTPTIAELTAAIEQEVERCPAARRLQTHPGATPPPPLPFLPWGGATEYLCCK